MREILLPFAVSLLLAYCSQNGIFVTAFTKKRNLDLPLIALIIMLSFFCGLRIDYNDTYLYIYNFKNAISVSEYFSTAPGVFDNPLFYGFQSFFRHHISDNYHLYFLTIGTFTNASMLRFIRKHTTNFVLSVTIFFAIGLYFDTMGAMKQTIAIAILTYAVEALIKRKYLLFYIIVFIAMLFHTYAIFFVILPLFLNRPWTVITYATVIGVVVLLFSFESTLTILMSAAEETGKNLAKEELMDNIGTHPLRLAVFAVPPMLSFFFQEYLNESYDSEKKVMMNMSILSFLVMSMGIFTAANLFGRSAGYFEIGSVIILPWIIEEIFDEQSARFMSIIVGICYLGFFMYLSQGFSDAYASIGIGQFFISLSK